MMDANKIIAEWKEDSKINPNELAEESNRIPQLHAKYLDYLSNERREMKKEKQRLKKLQFDKYEYFTGRMSTDKLQERGWKPFPHKVMKNDIDRYMEGDDDVIRQKMRVSELEENVETLESIIDNINRRTFVIGNSIKWMNFTNGVV